MLYKPNSVKNKILVNKKQYSTISISSLPESNRPTGMGLAEA